MRSSKAWILCVFSALGCGLGNPDLRVLPDDAAVAATDTGKAVDAGDPVEAGDPPDVALAEDAGTDDRPATSDDVGLDDAGADVVLADAGDDVAVVPDVTIADVVDAGDDRPDAAASDVVDSGSDVPVTPDVPAAPDVPPAMDVPATPDVPPAMDVPTTPDVPASPDVPTSPDVPPADVPPPDAGSPISWRLVTSDSSYTPWRGTAPGSPEVRNCPDGQVLVGLRTWSSDYVSGMAPWCAPLTAAGTLGMATLGGRVGGSHNDNGGDDDDLCPAGEVIVRFTGRSGGIIDRSQAVCAPLSTWLTTRALGRTLRQYGDSGGGSAFTDTCPNDYVGAGFEGSTRRDFDYFRDRLGSLRLRCVRVRDR